MFAFRNSCQKITQDLCKDMEKISWKTKTTWFRLILNDISKYSNINLSGDQEEDLESLEKICDNRKAWIKIVDCIMPSKKTKMQR